jgi:hypothetical protein
MHPPHLVRNHGGTRSRPSSRINQRAQDEEYPPLYNTGADMPVAHPIGRADTGTHGR